MSSLIRRKQLSELTIALFKEVLREKGVLFWGIIFPILMSLGLGIAFTKKTDVTRKVAVIEKRAPAGSARIGAFLREKTTRDTTKSGPRGAEQERYRITIPDEKLGDTTFIFEKARWEDAVVLLKRGNISVAIDEDEESGRIVFHFDPRNPDAQLTYLKLSRLFEERPGDEAAPGAWATPSDELVEPLTVSGTRYIDFLVPGLIAMGIMMSSLWGMSYGMVEKRSKKLLRRMVATPMKKSHFLLALMTVRTAMNFIEAGLLFLFAYLVFHITIQGDVSALVAIFLAGNVCFAGIAILTSARTGNTEIANGLINLVSLPMMVLSGIFFSYHNFPEWSVPYIQKLPLTLLADGMRSIFIEGAGYGGIALPAAILAAAGVVCFAAGLKIFRWY